MIDAGWLSRLPVVASLPAGQAAAKLREIGEDEIADALTAAPHGSPVTYGQLPRLRGRVRPWLHTAHAIGYLPPVDAPRSELLRITQASNIEADQTLKGARVKLTLDGLRVADYPGHGRHRILFDFAARNQTDQGPEQLHFNVTYLVADGEHAAAHGRPVFTGLRVCGEGLFLQYATVNVLNEDDEKLLRFLDNDAFKNGLQLLTTAQPVLAPFSAVAVGITQAIAARHRNVAVQAVDLGLDFSQIAPRPRLAEGSYIAVQIPESQRARWQWKEWRFDPANGRVINAHQHDLLIPYNYIIMSISRYADEAGPSGVANA